MKIKTSSIVTFKRILALVMAVLLLFGQSSIFGSVFAGTDSTFTAYQDGDVLAWWEGRESSVTDTYRPAMVAQIHITSGDYAGMLAYCIQNRKDGPKGESYNGFYPWDSTYGSKWADGVQVILQNGYPNVSRPFGTTSDDEAYYATTQAFRFWVAENGSAYTYEFSNLKGISDAQLREYARLGEIPDKLRSLNEQGDRALIAAIELLIMARNETPDKPNFNVTPKESNANLNGDYYVSYLDITLDGASAYSVSKKSLPTNTLVEDKDGNAAFTGRSSGRLTVKIPKFDAEGSPTDGMTFTAKIGFFADGLLSPDNVVLAVPVDETEDLNVQRLVFARNGEYLYQTSEVSIKTPLGEIPEEGSILVSKLSDADNAPIAGAKFGLYNPATGKYLNTDPYITDGNGQVTINHIAEGSYVLEELEGVDGYLFDVNNHPTQAITVTANKTTNVTFYNTPDITQSEKFKITVDKQDSVTGDVPQGGASLSGAIFEVIANENIDYVDKGKNLTITKGTVVDTLYFYGSPVSSKSIPVGEYKVVETYAPTGYTISDGPKIANKTNNSLMFYDDVIENTLIIDKYKDVLTAPEAGIRFEVSRVSRDGNGTVVEWTDTITTDRNGHAEITLPYGTYYVEQQNSTEGYAFVDPFYVRINSNTANYSYKLIDRAYKAQVEITKTDSETGKTIPSSSTCFNITNTDTKEAVTDETGNKKLCTNKFGVLDLETSLLPGNYSVTEVTAPDGYYRSPDDVTFVATNNPNTTTVIKLEFKNTPIKGKIEISKTGSVAGTPGVTQSDISVYSADGTSKKFDITNPGYTKTFVPGATIQVKAAENIVTLDGTTRFTKGELISEFVSGKEAKVIDNLYLGKYTVEETVAPKGYIRDTTVYEVTLTSEGQDVPVVVQSQTINNEIVSENIKLVKGIQDGVNLITDNINGYFVFGIFAGENIVIGDNQIDADTLVDLFTNNTTVHKTTLPEGAYYVKELGWTELGYNKVSDVNLNENKYPFVIDYDNLVDPILINDGNTVINTKTSVDVEISKKDKDGNLLGDAILTIKNQATNAEFDIVTEAGKTNTVSLSPGTYTLTEKKAPDGYLLDKTAKTFVVGKDGSVKGDTSIVNIKTEVTITKHNEAAEGLAGAKFKIYNSENALVLETNKTDAKGKVTVYSLAPGNYTYIESQAPAGYTLSDTVYSFKISNNGTVTGELIVVDYKTSATIHKTDEDMNPLADALIGIYAKDAEGEGYSTKVAEGRTNAEGNVTFASLPVGQYKIVELQAPSGYILNKDDTLLFEIHADGTVTGKTSFTNKAIGLAIQKTDSGTHQPIAGAKVKITNNNGYDNDFFTDENGLISLTKLADGTYSYQEIEAPEGYILNSKVYTFQVQNGVVTGDITFENTPRKAVINKQDEAGNPLEGVEISVWDELGNPYFTGLTDENGKLTINKILPGKYSYSEIKGLDGYIIDNTRYNFEVKEDGTVTGDTILVNIKTKLVVSKTNDENLAMENVKFKLLDANKAELGEYITNAEGKLYLNGLKVDVDYYLEEIETLDGYGLLEEPIKFKLKTDGTLANAETTELEIKNEIIKVVLDKQSTNGTYLKDAVFNVKNEALGYNQDFTTDDNGKIELKGLKPGTYKLKEVTAPSGYNLNSTEYEFTIDVYGNITGTTTIVNSPISSSGGSSSGGGGGSSGISVTIKKTDTDGEPLAGAKFTFYRNGNKLYTKTTDKKGQIRLTNLYSGTYTYKEIEAPEGYILSDDEYEFVIKNRKATGTLEVENHKEKEFEVPLYKKDVGSGNLLEGSKFEVRDEKDVVVATIVTDSKGKAIVKGLEPGKYTLSEVSAPNGYAIDTKSYTFEVTEDYEVKGTTTIADDVTKVNVYKTNEAGIALGGAKFGLFLKNSDMTAPAYTAISNANGIAAFEGVKVGEYILKEIEAPEGYNLSDKMVDISITDKHVNTNQQYAFVNTPIIPGETPPPTPEETPPPPPDLPHDTPKTDDASPVGLLSGMIALCAVGMIGVSIQLLRKKDEE